MTAIIHDFRSDTVTRPSAAMRVAMAAAPVGDDVMGEDPTVRRLEETVAARLGKATGLFFPSGTQANLAAIMTHCGRGDEYVVGQSAHCYRWEGGGAAVLGSIQPQPLVNQSDGTISLTDVAAAIKPDDPHYARTRLLALENTFHGNVLPADYITAALALACERGLSTHLDGARLFNAAVASGTSVETLAAGFDTVSVCLSKGLGAPIGSVLAGAPDTMTRARRWRKMLGGGMRQAGIVAAAGVFALDHNVARLADDHANARRLAERLARHADLSVEPPQTNIVFTYGAPAVIVALAASLATAGIGVSSLYDATCLRWVTHLDTDADAIDAAAKVVTAHFATPHAAHA